MGNDQLRTAIEEAGLLPEELADQIQVDHKTMHRWLAGRTPYPRHRAPLARALGRQQHELWPDATAQPASSDKPPEPDQTGTVTAYPTGDGPGVPDWRLLLESSTSQVDLLDYTLADLINEPGTLELLGAKSLDGCRVRILTSHPESIHLTITDGEQHAGHGIARKAALAHEAEQTRELLRPLQSSAGLQIRTFVAQRFNSILRFDDHMLVSLHLWGIATSKAPLLHLHAGTDNGLFDRFATHYDAIWNQAAKPVS